MAASAQLIAALALQIPPAAGTENADEKKLVATGSLAALTDTVVQVEIVPNDSISGDPQEIELQLAYAFEACTASTSTDKITDAGHGLADGDPVQLEATAMPGGLTAATTYYVRDSATDDFKLAETVGGAAIDIHTSNGTAVTYRKMGRILPSYTYPGTGPGVPVIIRDGGGVPVDFKKIRALQIVVRPRNIAADALATVQITAGDPSDEFGHFSSALRLNFTAGGDQTFPSATLFLPDGFNYDPDWPLTVRIKEGETNVNGLILINLLGN